MKIMNREISLNQIMMVILLGFSIFFFLKWYLAGSDTKEQTKEFKEKIERIEKEKKVLATQRDSMYVHYKVMELSIKEREKRIADLNLKLQDLQFKLVESKYNLEKIRQEIKVIKAKIDELTKNPVKRTGNDLLNSLDEKIKNR